MPRKVPRTGMRAGSAGSAIPVFPFPVHPVPHEETAAIPVDTPRVPRRPPRDSALPGAHIYSCSFSLSPGPGAHYGHRGDPATSEVVCSRTRDGPDRGAETKGCPWTGATDPAFVAAPAAASDREPL